MSSSQKPELCRYREAAAILDVSERHIMSLVAKGVLQRVRIGRASRVTRASLDAVIKGQAPKAARA